MVFNMRVKLRVSIPRSGAILVAGVPFSRSIFNKTKPREADNSYSLPPLLYIREMACHAVLMLKQTDCCAGNFMISDTKV